MRIVVLIAALAILPTTTAAAQAPPAFEDVPPWHWAYDSVQTVTAAGIFVGYPASDRDRVLNALTQVYDAFAHAAHPAAREWAERFLATLPPEWPQPLQRSRLVRFRLEGARVEAAGGDRIIVVVQVVAALRANGEIKESRTALRADLQRDAAGRLRVNYTALAAAHPEVFR